MYLIDLSYTPDISDTSVTFYIYDPNSYGTDEWHYLTIDGAGTVSLPVELQGGKSYMISALYNYSRAGGGNAGYLTTVEVTRM